jgi:hypothetical protein
MVNGKGQCSPTKDISPMNITGSFNLGTNRVWYCPLARRNYSYNTDSISTHLELRLGKILHVRELREKFSLAIFQ